MRFAIIVPVYNAEKYIRECLNSLLKQSYANFVVCLVDDGSSDNSSKILEEYAKKDNRFFVITKENEGVSSARNAGLRWLEENQINYDYVCFIDSDDLISDNYFYVCNQIAKKYDAEVIFTGVQRFDKRGSRNGEGQGSEDILLNEENIYDFAFKRGEFQKINHMACAQFIVNIVFFKDIILDDKFRLIPMGEDHDFIFRVLGRVKKAIATDETSYRYRLRGSSLSHTRIKKPDFEALFIWLDAVRCSEGKKRKIAEELLQRGWWSSLRRAYGSGVLSSCWDKFSLLLEGMLNSFSAESLADKKFQRRVRFFKYGRWMVQIYFFLRKNRKQMETCYYFD